MSTLEIMPQSEEIEIKNSFQEITEKLDSIKSQASALIVTDVTQKAEMKQARDMRLEIKALRISADKKRSEMKASLLKRGKLIDGAYSYIEDALKPLEAHLKAQEEFAEIFEANRKAKLKAEREEKLKPYGVSTQYYDLGAMPEEAFTSLLTTTELAHKAKIEAAAKAEADRLAKIKADEEAAIQRKAEEAALAERRRIENEKLKAEAEAARKALAEQQEKARAEREQRQAEEFAREEIARKEREALRKQAEAAEAEARKIKAEAEAKAKADREAAAKAEAERRALEAAPDAVKLRGLIASIDAVKVPELTSIQGQRAGERIEGLLCELIQYVVEEIKILEGKQ